MKRIILWLSCAFLFFAAGYWLGSTKRPLSHISSSPALNRDVRQTQNITVVRNNTIPAFVVTEETVELPLPTDLSAKIHQSFYRQGVELLIDTMSLTDLVPLTASITGLETAKLWDMQQPHLFARQLVNLYLDDCGVLRGREGIVSSVNFAHEGAHINGTVPRMSSHFKQTATARIYAHFTLPADYVDDILVKWCNDERNLIYSTYEIDPKRPLNYVWWQPVDNTMEFGEHFVSVWSTTESPQLIATGSYEVIE